MKRRLLFFFLLVNSFAFAQNNIYRSGGITQTIGTPTFTPGASGNIVAIDTVTGEWYVNPNRLSGASWISAGYRLTVISGSIAPAYTPTAHQSHFVINAANRLYYWTGSAWVNINAGGGGGGTTYYPGDGIDITNDTINIDTVQRLIFHSGQTYTGGIGAMRWNDTEGTLDLGLKNGNVTLQLGQESLQLVKHADNSGLTDGKVVYLVGSSGTNMTVRYARADNESTSANTFGLMTESATGGNKAFCTTFGLVRNINTDNLTEGGMVWLSKDTAGAMTAVRPTAPNHGVEIGFCVRKHATQGVIFVTVQNGYELNELHNVYVPSPASNQVLTFNSANNRWQAATVADQSATNEGILGVSAGSATTSVITSNTDGATGVTIEAGSGISISETTSTNGGTVTVTNNSPDQTVSITNGGGITPSGTYPNFTLTATDQSITNEIQTIDTFSLSGQTLRASLSNDNQPAKTVTLPVVGITAGTNVTVSQAAGVYTINSTGGGGGGISGITNYIPKFNSSTTIDTSGLYWVGGKLGLRTVAPNGLLEIKGTAATDTATQLGAELLTTGTGTGWTGTSFASGYTHTTGTTALTANSLTVTTATTYTLVVTVTGRTVGTCTVTVGGLTTGAISTNTTVTVRGSTTATTNLSVATSSTFNGTVVVSLKLALPTTPSITLENARGNISLEIRSSKDSTNTAVGLNALGQITTGYGNYVYGFDAAKNLTAGYQNILIGPINTITSGFRNIIITPSSSSFISSGFNGVYIGYGVTPSSGSAQNEIVIGNTQGGLGSGTTIIGRATTTTRTHIVGALTTTTGNVTSISNIAQLYSQGSTTTSAGKAFVVENSTPTSLYEIRNDGKISYLATNTAAGTTGAQTIDKPSGTVNFAAGASALVVTNSLVATTSIVFAAVRTNDSTAYVKNVVPAAGSFTINLGAAATAETSVGFWVIN